MKNDFKHFALWILCCLIISKLYVSAQPPNERNTFVPPVDVPLYLTSNYGEIREAHFHSGIDFLAETGSKVYAIKEGYVSRIAVTLNGYGKAVYIAHPNGYTSVYGHLSEFMPEIEKYVKDQQYQRRKYVINLYPEADKFPVLQGQIIAFSGNTGYSFGPHLHFEIRDSRGAIPLNVLTFDFPVADSRTPRITCLGIYPINPHAQVDGTPNKVIIPLKNNNGNKYSIPGPVKVWGDIGFGIETYDYLDGRENMCSPFSVSLVVDDKLKNSFELDRISFGKSSYVNSHIDYAEKVSNGRKIQKLFVDPNNKLDIYKGMINNGICTFTDSLEHKVSVQVKDVAGNQASLDFHVISSFDEKIPSDAVHPHYADSFYYNTVNVYETEQVKIALPNGALFTHIDFRYKAEKAADTLFSALHHVHEESTPVHGTYMISIKPVNLPQALSSKAIIVMIDNKDKISSTGGHYKNGYVTSRAGSFGRFAIFVDTMPPEINPVSFVSKKKYTTHQIISFRIKDDLSGIGTYNGFIDGKWALFEFDAKNDLLFYRPDASRLQQNKEHTLELIITDRKDNIRKFKGRFYF
ncbi:MAG: M23 family metallopeptidase [Bacteroidales bacterium]|nr:M23 family metallopeptidase [Bacteroidales bacterium]MBN2764219.1 M23 family metallopeptidase [Bacteroidales bacterium]